jgi:hypothetical protein
MQECRIQIGKLSYVRDVPAEADITYGITAVLELG